METSGYAGGAQGVDRAYLEGRSKSYTKKATVAVFFTRQAISHQERAGETTRSRVYQGSLPSRVAGQPRTCPKKEQQRVKDVR